MTRPIAMVTGASSGFGEAIARRFAQEGWNVIITGRRTERLQALANELEQSCEVSILPVSFDVRDAKAVSTSLNDISEEWRKVEVLVNNAGLAVGRNSIDKGDLEDWGRMIDTNIKGLLYVTRNVVQWMKANQLGHIVNIGSIAGKEVYNGGNVYCATKFAVDALSKAMRVEFIPYGVKVTQIAPGAAETEFSLVRFKGDSEKANQVYQGYKALTAEDIADTLWFAVTRPAHVCLNDIVIMPSAQPNSYTFQKN
ncbi:MAG: SDR family NAD(P)-dependent oxidoreductase [Flavobacteriales bacterium]|nr:SDR family NAD(P)-dependent oxidoreductase [Flavobacteriales bacterium]MDG1779426.1 SDR family NAD(P)-dependent oxidoreductase [Flavobacteriales bacterium]MDG2245200.1 SDR family NAD(P)-dependent oxidoreductase [Flavobacteriales bacterium]